MKKIIRKTVGATDRVGPVLGAIVALVGLIMVSNAITPRTGNTVADELAGDKPQAAATGQSSVAAASGESTDSSFNPPASPTPTGCILGAPGNAAGFQIDGDFFSNTDCVPTGGTKDWAGAMGVLLQAGGVVIIPPLGGASCNSATNSCFFRDDVWCAGDIDNSTFAGGQKNADLIDPTSTHWATSTGSGPQKNDIENVFVHTRKDAANNHRWLILAAETRATNGNSFLDFEYNQAGVTWDPVAQTIRGCTNGGSCVGGRTVGDILVVVDYINGGTIPVVGIRTWLASGAWSDPPMAPVPPFAFIVTNNADVTAVAPGAAYLPDNSCTASNTTANRQLVEAGIDLTNLNLQLNLCTPMATVTCKTRSSASFTSDLKDFVLFHFIISPPPPCDITGPNGPVCPGTTNLQYCAPAGANSYSWSISGNGTIVGSTTGRCVTVSAGSNCNQPFTLTVTVTNSDNCPNMCGKTVQVQDTTAPTITCPPDVTVTCLSNVPPANFAGGTASDNCSSVNITSSQTTTNISPCGVACGGRIHRTYRATDACGNFRECTQNITYGSPGTAANPQQEFLASLLKSGDLVVGVPGTRSLTIPGGPNAKSSAFCLVTKMSSGGIASELPDFGDMRLDPATCQTSPSLELQKDGTWRNVAVSQAVSLALNLRVAAEQQKHWARQGQVAKVRQTGRADARFDLVSFMLTPTISTQGASPGPDDSTGALDGQLDLSSARTQFMIPTSVLRALGSNATAVDLLKTANAALAGQSTPNVKLLDLAAALDAVNRSFDFGKRRLIVNTDDSFGTRRVILSSNDAAK